MTTNEAHVVLGATGGAGNAIARALIDRGLPVRGVNRSGRADLPSGIDVVAADITTGTGAAKALDGAAVIYMAAQPAYHRWSREFPDMLAAVIAEAERTGAKLVMIDNLYMYGPGHEVLREDTPATATDRKGVVRHRMFDSLMAVHERGSLRVTIGQASDYFGPRADNSGVTALAIEPAAGGGKLRWMGSLDAPHSVAYLPDIARAYATLGTSDEADGRAWILPHGEAVTGRSFLSAVNASLGEDRSFAVVSPMMLRLAAPFHRISRESVGIAYQWTQPWIADDTAFQAAFGPFATTPLDVAIKESLDWYRSHDG
jgi:nucleoside-diphosphate-sugar epimerase